MYNWRLLGVLPGILEQNSVYNAIFQPQTFGLPNWLYQKHDFGWVFLFLICYNTIVYKRKFKSKLVLLCGC